MDIGTPWDIRVDTLIHFKQPCRLSECRYMHLIESPRAVEETLKIVREWTLLRKVDDETQFYCKYVEL